MLGPSLSAQSPPSCLLPGLPQCAGLRGAGGSTLPGELVHAPRVYAEHWLWAPPWARLGSRPAPGGGSVSTCSARFQENLLIFTSGTFFLEMTGR